MQVPLDDVMVAASNTYIPNVTQLLRKAGRLVPSQTSTLLPSPSVEKLTQPQGVCVVGCGAVGAEKLCFDMFLLRFDRGIDAGAAHIRGTLSKSGREEMLGYGQTSSGLSTRA